MMQTKIPFTFFNWNISGVGIKKVLKVDSIRHLPRKRRKRSTVVKPTDCAY